MHQGAAVIAYLSPGLRFFHQGQNEGRKIHIPPHVVRGPSEMPDRTLQQFCGNLLDTLYHPSLHGSWRLLGCTSAWDGNWTSIGCIAGAGRPPAPGARWSRSTMRTTKGGAKALVPRLGGVIDDAATQY